MALTRGRVVAANAKFGKAIEAAIAEILSLKRTPAKLARQMDEVRQKYFEELGSENIWSVRQVRGGLVDAEYILQFHLLKEGHKHGGIFNPDFETALGNLEQVKAITKKDAASLLKAHDFYLEIHGLLRLCHAENPNFEDLSPSLLSLMAGATEIPNAGALNTALKETQAWVYTLYKKHISRYVTGK